MITNHNERALTRRQAVTAASLGAIALAGLASKASADSHTMSATEKANVAVVSDFFRLWSNADCTGEKLAAFVADDCVLRMAENKPTVEGHTAAVAAFEVFLEDGQRFGINVLDTLTIGPIVANSRSDYVIVPGKEPGGRFAVAGVFVMRDGKIQEWADYIVPKS